MPHISQSMKKEIEVNRPEDEKVSTRAWKVPTFLEQANKKFMYDLLPNEITFLEELFNVVRIAANSN